MKSIYKTLGLVIALVVICARFAFAYPSWYDPEKGIGFKPGVPDFYQHQCYKTDSEWEKSGGWCWPTAFVNSLFYWDKNGYDNLFDETPGAWTDDKIKDGKWTEDMVKDMKTNIKETANDLFKKNEKNDYIGSITKILNDRGHPPDKLPLQVTMYKWDGGEFIKSYDEIGLNQYRYRSETQYTSMFRLYKGELLRCEDILIRLMDTDPNDPQSWWWSGPNYEGGNYHVVTGTGIEFKTCQETKGKIWFADPNDTYHKPGFPKGWDDFGNNQYKYKVDDELPFGQKYYDWAEIGEDGTILSGYYKDAKIYQILTISPVPEPGTLLLLGSGLAGIIGFGRKKLSKKA